MKALLNFFNNEHKYQKEIILSYIFTVRDDHGTHGSYSSFLFAQMPRHKPLVDAESQLVFKVAITQDCLYFNYK